MVHVFCKHLSPGDESARNPKPKGFSQVERNPSYAGSTIWRTTADHPAEEMSERRDHSKNLSGKARIELCAKSIHFKGVRRFGEGQSVNIGQELLTVVPPNYLPSPRSGLR
jgi:hypothetical protein